MAMSKEERNSRRRERYAQRRNEAREQRLRERMARIEQENRLLDWWMEHRAPPGASPSSELYGMDFSLFAMAYRVIESNRKKSSEVDPAPETPATVSRESATE